MQASLNENAVAIASPLVCVKKPNGSRHHFTEAYVATFSDHQAYPMNTRTCFVILLERLAQRDIANVDRGPTKEGSDLKAKCLVRVETVRKPSDHVSLCVQEQLLAISLPHIPGAEQPFRTLMGVAFCRTAK